MNGQRPIHRNTYFLAVGINKYQQLQELYNATRDAAAVCEAFKTRYGVKDFTELYDEKATKSEVEKALSSLIKKSSENDNIVIYYSGHGSQEALLPVDAEEGEMHTHLLHETLKGFLARIKCHHLLMVVDACYASSIVSVTRSGATASEAYTVDQEPSRWAIFSSADNRKAADGKPGEHSPFARGFLETLNSVEGAETLSSFYNRLRKVVEKCYNKLQIEFVVPKLYQLHLHNNRGEFVFKPKPQDIEVLSNNTTTRTNLAPNFEIAKINCDRKKVMSKFLQAFEKRQEAVVQHFFIFNQKYFHADYVVKRMLLSLKKEAQLNIKLRDDVFLPNTLIFTEINLEDDADGDDFLFELRNALRKELQANNSKIQSLSDWQKSEQAQQSWRQYQYIPVVLKVPCYRKSWSNYLQKGTNWLLQDFSKTDNSSNHRFVFFMILDAKTESEDIFGDLEAFLSNHEPIATLLPRLTLITEEDIHEWFRNNGFADNDYIINNFLKSIKPQLGEPIAIDGSDKKGWTMGKVAKYLSDFCQSYFEQKHGIS